MDARNRFQGTFPSFFDIVTDGANNTQASNYTATFVRGHTTPKIYKEIPALLRQSSAQVAGMTSLIVPQGQSNKN
jgi:hypothetical protein